MSGLARMMAEGGNFGLRLIVGSQARTWELGRRLRGDRGQTTTEYLVIAGLGVALVLGIWTLFGNGLQTAVSKLTGGVGKAMPK